MHFVGFVKRWLMYKYIVIRTVQTLGVPILVVLIKTVQYVRTQPINRTLFIFGDDSFTILKNIYMYLFYTTSFF